MHTNKQSVRKNIPSWSGGFLIFCSFREQALSFHARFLVTKKKQYWCCHPITHVIQFWFTNSQAMRWRSCWHKQCSVHCISLHDNSIQARRCSLSHSVSGGQLFSWCFYLTLMRWVKKHCSVLLGTTLSPCNNSLFFCSTLIVSVVKLWGIDINSQWPLLLFKIVMWHGG